MGIEYCRNRQKGVKLVRGAYIEGERILAESLNKETAVWSAKHETDKKWVELEIILVVWQSASGLDIETGTIGLVLICLIELFNLLWQSFSEKYFQLWCHCWHAD